MKLTILQLPKIESQYITVHGAQGDESILNQGPGVPRPVGTLIYADTTGCYGDDPGHRVELWETSDGTATSAEIFAACPYIRDHKERLIRLEGAARLSALANPYEPAERETWPYQRSEALAWVSDNAAPTPFCDIIAAGRGIPRVYFIPKVLENSTLFSQASAAILGQQQALIDRLWLEQDFSTFWGISWP